MGINSNARMENKYGRFAYSSGLGFFFRNEDLARGGIQTKLDISQGNVWVVVSGSFFHPKPKAVAPHLMWTEAAMVVRYNTEHVLEILNMWTRGVTRGGNNQ